LAFRFWENMTRALVSPAVPFAMAVVGIALFSLMDTQMKGLSIAIGAYNAMLWRVWVGAILAGGVFLARREKRPTNDAVRLHLIRGAVASVMAVTFFWGIARVPLAEGIALSFIAPLLTLYLAAVMLGETIGRYAILASAVALVGVAVILGGRIGYEVYDKEALWGILSILVSAVLYAFNLILQRRQAQVASPIEIAFFQSLVAGCCLALAAPFLAVFPDARHWPAIVISALLAIVSLLLLSWAYARAEAQVLVTVEYTAFIWAAIFGYFFFGERVAMATFAGGTLIVLGCIIATRKHPSHLETTAL
jgi:S-adenosylmethionine uptake transporter